MFLPRLCESRKSFFNKEQSEQQVAKAAMQLRLDAVQHIRKHRALYEAAWCNDDMEKQYKRAGQPAPKSFDGFLKPRKAITSMSTSSRRLPPALEHRWLSGERIARKWVMSKTKKTIRQKISSVQICGTGVFGHPVSSKTRLAVIRNVLALLLCCHLTITHVFCLLSIRNLRLLHG